MPMLQPRVPLMVRRDGAAVFAMSAWSRRAPAPPSNGPGAGRLQLSSAETELRIEIEKSRCR